MNQIRRFLAVASLLGLFMTGIVPGAIASNDLGDCSPLGQCGTIDDCEATSPLGCTPPCTHNHPTNVVTVYVTDNTRINTLQHRVTQKNQRIAKMRATIDRLRAKNRGN